MPSYLQLQQEEVWRTQFTPDNLLDLLIIPLRNFYGLGPAAVGAAGDNNHLYGRHRSANWDLTSIYCTDRSYGTTNSKDRQGDLNWYRAVDVGIQGPVLWDASHRMDKAVRAGQMPGVAEWFGTFDGQTVVGWFEGHPSSSDDSHLSHLHVGFWNQNTNDANVLRQAFEIITGEDVATPEETAAAVWKLVWKSKDQPNPNDAMAADVLFGTNQAAFECLNLLKEIKAMLASGIEVPALVGLTPEALDAVETQVYNVLNGSKIMANNPED